VLVQSDIYAFVNFFIIIRALVVTKCTEVLKVIEQ